MAIESVPNSSNVTIQQYVETRFNMLEVKNAETHLSMDLRYQQRFEAQKEALAAAFTAQQSATQIALIAAERAVQAALQAAERAVQKAELANDKRFDSVDEFRQTLSDQQTTLLTRAEFSATFNALVEKISELKDITTGLITRAEFTKVEESLQILQQAKANLDGRLVVLTGGISTGITIALWAVGKFLGGTP